MVESDIQREVMAYLKTVPEIRVWRSNAGRVQKNVHMAPPGCPDIIGYVLTGRKKGKFIGFEVKKPGKGLTKKQREWAMLMTRSGCYYFMVHSVNVAKECVRYFK